MGMSLDRCYVTLFCVYFGRYIASIICTCISFQYPLSHTPASAARVCKGSLHMPDWQLPCSGHRGNGPDGTALESGRPRPLLLCHITTAALKENTFWLQVRESPLYVIRSYIMLYVVLSYMCYSFSLSSFIIMMVRLVWLLLATALFLF